MTDQRANQPIGIDPIRLRPPRSAVHLQARRVQYMVVNAVGLQHPMQPEPVVTCLVARHYFDRPAELPAYPDADPLDQLKQRLGITWLQLVLTSLLRQGRLKPDDPARLAQLDCNKAMHRVIINSGGRGVLHAAFHRSLLCGWWVW